jgi:predicted amidohydrolase
MQARVALIQMKPKLGPVAANVEECVRLIEEARDAGAQIAVLPELALTGYFLKDLVPEVARSLSSPELVRLKELSRDISIVAGFVEVTADYQFYNSAVWFEDGELLHLHRKVYLPTYGLFDEQRYLGRGDRFRAFDSKFGRVGMLVCEDMWHLSAPYLLAMDGATTLVCLSSSPGRGVSGETLATAESWRSLTSSVARFLTCQVIYVNRVGFEDGLCFWGGSHVVGPDGETLHAAAEFDQALEICALSDASLRRERISSPLVRDEQLDLTLRELSRITDERSW